MTIEGLEALLESGRGGTWFIPGNPAAKALGALAREAGFTFFHLDGHNIARKEQLLNAMSVALRFPKHFGDNWDALEECLQELEGGDLGGFLLYYDHADVLANAHPDQFETLVEICKDAVASWKEDGTAMVILFSGDKPPKGVLRLKAPDAD